MLDSWNLGVVDFMRLLAVLDQVFFVRRQFLSLQVLLNLWTDADLAAQTTQITALRVIAPPSLTRLALMMEQVLVGHRSISEGTDSVQSTYIALKCIYVEAKGNIHIHIIQNCASRLQGDVQSVHQSKSSISPT